MSVFNDQRAINAALTRKFFKQKSAHYQAIRCILDKQFTLPEHYHQLLLDFISNNGVNHAFIYDLIVKCNMRTNKGNDSIEEALKEYWDKYKELYEC